MDTDAILACARAYVEAGLSVVPVRPTEKYPSVAWKEFQGRRASPEELEAWFTSPGNLRIGIVTGPISGVFVLDVDYRHGGHHSIDESKLMESALAVAVSPGGRHYWYRWPTSRPIRSKNAWRQGVDLKADRAITLVPPSGGYSWERRMDGS